MATCPVHFCHPLVKFEISGLLATLPAQPRRPHFLASTPEIVLSVNLEFDRKRRNLAQFLVLNEDSYTLKEDLLKDF